MRVSYCPGYFVELPPRHPFPMGKFPELHRTLLAEGLVRPDEVFEPEPATWESLALVHTTEYLERLQTGSLGRTAERRMGIPWSEALVRRSRLAVQGTLNAARMALEDGVAANLAGGTHHAFAGHGEGFCVLNDVAVAIRVLVGAGEIGRALVVDLDVHQGNGTADIFSQDASAYTFSMHGEKNYPFEKTNSSRDVAVPDQTGDTVYVALLKTQLPEVLTEARPDLALYLAGVDPVAGDRYGRLALTPAGLGARDRLVLQTMRDSGTPVVVLMSGGYAASAEATADLHAIAHREARHVFA